jgi:hypothetical protein
LDDKKVFTPLAANHGGQYHLLPLQSATITSPQASNLPVAAARRHHPSAFLAGDHLSSNKI